MWLAPGTLVVLRQPFNQVLTLGATGSLESCETMACIWRLAILAVIVEIITKMFILMLLIIIITKNQWFDRKPFVWDFTAPGLPNPTRCLIDPNDIIIGIPIRINPLFLSLSLSNNSSCFVIIDDHSTTWQPPPVWISRVKHFWREAGARGAKLTIFRPLVHRSALVMWLTPLCISLPCGCRPGTTGCPAQMVF